MQSLLLPPPHTPPPLRVPAYDTLTRLLSTGKIEWKGAEGIIKVDGVGSKFVSKKSVRLSKLGIWHKTSGDIKERPNDAMRLNWTL